jgi:histidinol phosphatase-like enzyme
MANSILSNAKDIKEYGKTVDALDAQEKAYYQAMATNAQSLIDLNKFTEQEVNQMSNVVDDDLIKTYEEEEKKRLEKMVNNGDKEGLQKAKEDFVKETYGDNARIKDN